MTIKILYRVDAGNIVGTGHMREILSIHTELKKCKSIEADACINDSNIAENLMELSGIGDVRKVSIETETIELEQIDHIYQDKQYSFVILSVLDRSPGYYEQLKKKFGQTIVILDNKDLALVDATLCINYSILQKKERYLPFHSANETEYWIGPDYFPFQPSINMFGAKRDNSGVNQIFVNQGGSDPQGLTKKILIALRTLQLKNKVVVVIGSGLTKRHREEVEFIKETLPENYKFYENIPIQEMHNFMYTSDLALTAAGNTLYELARLGIPSIVISHHNKHDLVAREFASRGAVVNLGIGTNISEAVITKATRILIENSERRLRLSDNARLITDGRGMERIVDYVLHNS